MVCGNVSFKSSFYPHEAMNSYQRSNPDQKLERDLELGGLKGSPISAQVLSVSLILQHTCLPVQRALSIMPPPTARPAEKGSRHSAPWDIMLCTIQSLPKSLLYGQDSAETVRRHHFSTVLTV